MKKRFFTIMLLLVFLGSLTGIAQAISPATMAPIALVYVNLISSDDVTRFASTQLPVYALIEGGLLSAASQADQQKLRDAGLSFQVVDPDLRSGTYYLAEDKIRAALLLILPYMVGYYLRLPMVCCSAWTHCRLMRSPRRVPN